MIKNLWHISESPLEKHIYIVVVITYIIDINWIWKLEDTHFGNASHALFGYVTV